MSEANAIAKERTENLMNTNNQVTEMLEVQTGHGALAKTAKRLRRAKVATPSCEDPREELRHLVRQHVALTKVATANMNMGRDKTDRTTGDVIKCRLPADAMIEVQGLAKILTKKANGLESAMLRELRKIPIYTLFLKHVFGVGPIVAAYLVSEIDIQRATKPSNLRRFCGLAVINGRLEGSIAGQVNRFSKEMRKRIFQALCAMWKNAAKKSAAAPYGVTTKYLDVWRGYQQRIEHSDRVFDRGVDATGTWTGKLVNGQGKTVSARGFARSTGWHKAADVLVEDLYTMWRAIEGLPVWPSYYAAKLGYEHGGKISVNAPRMLSVEEAQAVVGVVGAVPLAQPLIVADVDDTELDDESDT